MTIRRFYQDAVATPELGVALDARTLRTPGGAVFTTPTHALANAVAQEWMAQGDEIVPSDMPLTQLAFAAIDWTAKSRVEQIGYIAAHAETDLVCHRADAPAALVARQAALWDPIVHWAIGQGVMLPVVTGVVAARVEPASLQTLRQLASQMDDFRLTALAQAVGLSGSALIALAVVSGRLAADEAFAAAALDNLWSLEQWGEDAEARAKLDSQRAALENVARFVVALGGP